RQGPDPIHDLACVTGIVLSYRNNHQVVKDSGERHVIIDDFGKLALQQRKINSLDRFAHPAIFLRRLADDDGLIDRLLAMRNAGDVKHRKLIFKRVVAGVIAERAFNSQLVRIDVAFQHDLGTCRHFDIYRLAFHHLDRFLAQEPGDHHLVQVFGQRHNRREDRHRIGPYGHSYVEPSAAASLQVAKVLSAVFVNLPMHAGGLFVVNLHAIHPAVSFAGRRVIAEHQRHRYVSAAVFGPALDDWKIEKRELAFLQYSFFARSVFDDLRKHLSQIGQSRNHLDLLDQALGRFDIGEFRNAFRDFTVVFDTERNQHSLAGAECVDEDGNGVSANVLEQERRAVLPGHAVGYFGDLEFNIDLNAYAFQLAGFFERLYEISKIIEWHR